MEKQLKNVAAVPGDLSVAQFAKMIADQTAEYRGIVAPFSIQLD